MSEFGLPLKRYRRARVDPSKLDVATLTGEENVWVVNKETGKRITGAKAPPLKHLLQWLERNPMFDVDPKWAHIVKAKVGSPPNMTFLLNSIDVFTKLERHPLGA